MSRVCLPEFLKAYRRWVFGRSLASLSAIGGNIGNISIGAITPRVSARVIVSLIGFFIVSIIVSV
jgi:hypothetical protein